MSSKDKDPEIAESNKSLEKAEKVSPDSKDSRRSLLKKLAVGGIAGAAMPTQWSRPVVDAVMLPAHAQTSDATIVGGGGTSAPPGPAPGDSIGEDVLDFFVSEASAGGSSIRGFCIEVSVRQNNMVITGVTCTKICFNPGCFADEEKFYDQTMSSVALTGSGSNWSGSISTRNGLPEPMLLTLTGLDTSSSTLCTATLGASSGDLSGPVMNGGTCNCPCPAKPRPI